MIIKPPSGKDLKQQPTIGQQVKTLSPRDRMVRLLVLLLVGLTCYGFFFKIVFF